MAVKRPTLDQLQDVALSLGIHLSPEQASTYNTLLQGNFDAYDVVDAMPDYLPVVTYPRTPGYRPTGAENKYGAWYVKTTIKGAAKGKLSGKTVVLKDNVCLAGVPMMNGASTLEGYVPNVVYTCGALRHGGRIILPYAVSDTYSNFATIEITALLRGMRG
mgnify:CR=1 FL=1